MGLDERPEIHSSNWEWDTAQPAEQWKHSHNSHHQFTNVLGHDNDIGYGVLRVAREQKWHPPHPWPAGAIRFFFFVAWFSSVLLVAAGHHLHLVYVLGSVRYCSRSPPPRKTNFPSFAARNLEDGQSIV